MDSWTRYPSLADSASDQETTHLRRYCLLGRIGDFKLAQDVWDRSLRQREQTFLYAISHIDVVLRQTRYGDALDFLERILRTAQDTLPPQLRVYKTMKAYLDVFVHGRLRAALEIVRENLRSLSDTSMDQYDDYQVRIRSFVKDKCSRVPPGTYC